MNEDERIMRNLMDMQHHFNEMVSAYERLPSLKNPIRKTILEDALSVIAVSMEGITHEIADLYNLVPFQHWSSDEPLDLSVENRTIIEIKSRNPRREEE